LHSQNESGALTYLAGCRKKPLAAPATGKPSSLNRNFVSPVWEAGEIFLSLRSEKSGRISESMNTDPIADYLTRVRNAIKANHRVVEIPASKIKKEITKVLYQKGYIQSYRFDDSSVQGTIKIALKYNPTTKQPAITKLDRISTPGLRKYSPVSDLPRVLSGLGVAIISTSKGVMTEKEAKTENVGGEVLCYVY
jgi:small subunit ribosomal protein S8